MMPGSHALRLGVAHIEDHIIKTSEKPSPARTADRVQHPFLRRAPPLATDRKTLLIPAKAGFQG
jgi:hypothetical protein